MSRYVCFAILMITIPAAVFAVSNYPPPAHGVYQGGWGMNPTNWDAASGSFSAWGLYDPLHGGDGDAWVVDWTDPNNLIYIDYAPITLELWIELYCMQTYHYTSYQWHRLGNQEETICFTVTGSAQCNNAVYCALTKKNQDLTHIYFVEDIFGRTNYGPLPPSYPNPTADIPIAWQARWGRGLMVGENVQWGWNTVVPDPDDLRISINEPCDHWFEFEGCFTIPYHQPDGYYMLEMGGCPGPEL
jgi:hypothetical protein